MIARATKVGAGACTRQSVCCEQLERRAFGGGAQYWTSVQNFKVGREKQSAWYLNWKRVGFCITMGWLRPWSRFSLGVVTGHKVLDTNKEHRRLLPCQRDARGEGGGGRSAFRKGRAAVARELDFIWEICTHTLHPAGKFFQLLCDCESVGIETSD